MRVESRRRCVWRQFEGRLRGYSCNKANALGQYKNVATHIASALAFIRNDSKGPAACDSFLLSLLVFISNNFDNPISGLKFYCFLRKIACAADVRRRIRVTRDFKGWRLNSTCSSLQNRAARGIFR